MKAKDCFRELLCLKFSLKEGTIVLFILLSNSCLNRPALAQSSGKVIAFTNQLLKGSTVKLKADRINVND